MPNSSNPSNPNRSTRLVHNPDTDFETLIEVPVGPLPVPAVESEPMSAELAETTDAVQDQLLSDLNAVVTTLPNPASYAQWGEPVSLDLGARMRRAEEEMRARYARANASDAYTIVDSTIRRSVPSGRPIRFTGLEELATGKPKRGRKPKSRKSMEQFASTSGLRGALPLIKAGFEFEFHRLIGPNSNQFDEFRFSRDLAAHMAEQTLYTLLYHHRRDEDFYGPSSDAVTRAELWNVIRRSELKSVSKLPKEVQELATAWERTLQERAVESWTRRHRKQYISPANTEDIPEWSTINKYTELGTDSSVRGGEIRTQGGRTIPEFLRAARVLSRANWEIDVDCSFHIHLSLKDVEHRWGARLQAEMYAYLIANRHRMPEAVQRRLLAPLAGAKYARFKLENGHKYCAIYRHDEYNTWEFRLFGGVSKYQEMVQCLTLAVDTLKHAYAVKLGQRESLVRNYSEDQISYALEAMYPRMEPGEATGETDQDGDDIYGPEREIPGIGLEGFFAFLEKQSLKVRDIEADAA